MRKVRCKIGTEVDSSFTGMFASGEYTFKVKMSGLTAACTVELWISNDTDPMNMQKVLRLEYPEVVLWVRTCANLCQKLAKRKNVFRHNIYSLCIDH